MKPSQPLTLPDGEVRDELSADELAAFQPSASVLPLSVQHKLGMRRRGPQKAPTKVATTIRLSSEVIDYFKAGGHGWQGRMDNALKAFIAEHPRTY